jgi:OmpA-OmpF porin, OOP family
MPWFLFMGLLVIKAFPHYSRFFNKPKKPYFSRVHITFCLMTVIQPKYLIITLTLLIGGQTAFCQNSTWDYPDEILISGCTKLEVAAIHGVNQEKLDYRWVFPDGKEVQGRVVIHCFDRAGKYVIRQITKDMTHDRIVRYDSLTINLRADFKLDFVSTVKAGGVTEMESVVSGKAKTEGVEIFWDLGDGEFASGEKITYRFVDPSKKTVRVLAKVTFENQTYYLSKTATVSQKYANVSGGFPQQIKWAASVLDFTSQYSPFEYNASKALGPPDVVGIGARKSNAWRAKNPEKPQFIVLEFDHPEPINQVLVVEGSWPSQLREIVLYDDKLNPYPIDSIMTKYTKLPELRSVLLRFPLTTYSVRAVRIEMKMSKTETGSIDAVGISSDKSPIENAPIVLDRISADDFELIRLGSQVNSKYNELNPILSADGNRLYFSRQYHPDNIGGVKDREDIWFAEKDPQTGEWGPAKNMGAPWNNEHPNFIASIAVVDGRETFILGNQYLKGGQMKAGISMAFIENGEYSAPINMDINGYFNYSNRVDFFMTPDGQTLLISSESEISYGLYDLYVCKREGPTKWSAPINLGFSINTTGMDESPFLSNDGTTLYFSSDGYNGYGGKDVFSSKRLDDTWTNWSTPMNIGPTVNGPGDEKYFIVPASNEHMFFSKGEPRKDLDIYQVRFKKNYVVLRGRVEDLDGIPVQDADVVFVGQDAKYYYTRTDADGEFENLVAENTTWKVAVAKNSMRQVEEVAVNVSKSDTTVPVIKMKMLDSGQSPNPFINLLALQSQEKSNVMNEAAFWELLDNMKEGDVIGLFYVHFDRNSSYLQPKSFVQLDALAEFLKSNQDIRVELSAHTDSRESHEYNQWLSDRRANRVKEYLVNKEALESNIDAQGYGETQLLNDCSDNKPCKESQHQVNRRVEIKILKRGAAVVSSD